MNQNTYSIKSINILDREVKLSSILDESDFNNICKKLCIDNQGIGSVYAAEIIKFLYLTSHSNNDVFFPGNEMLDKFWHELILETKLYRKVNDKIKKYSFVDHTSITYTDYSKNYSTDTLLNEQLTWLASYVRVFGKINEHSYEILTLAKEISNRLNLDVHSLNTFANTLGKIADVSFLNNYDLPIAEYLKSLFSSDSQEVDNNSNLMSSKITEFVGYLNHAKSTSEITILSNEEMELAFQASTAFGFSICQHFAAIERLSLESDWQKINSNLWSQLKKSELLCGLATTHIVKKDKALITGNKITGGYEVNGYTPWCCGFGIFDKLIIGFDTGENIVFAMTDYPKSLAGNSHKISEHNLENLNGTASVKIEFNNLFIPEDSIVSVRSKNSNIKIRKTQYLGYELGLGKRALLHIKNKMTEKSSLKSKKIEKKLAELFEKYRILVVKKNNLNESSDLSNQFYKFNRESIRLLTFFDGANALLKGSLSSLLQSQIMLFDVVLHSEENLNAKIESVGND